MNKYIKQVVSLLAVLILFTACEHTELDLTDNPNQLSTDQADPNLLLNAMQIAYIGNQEVLSEIAGELTRIEYFFGRDYFNSLPSSTLDGVWRRTYSSETTGIGDSGALNAPVGILTNLQAIEGLNALGGADYSFHVAVGKILYAHSILQLVDFVGQATFSQAGNAVEFPAPTLDEGAAAYDGALSLLGEAEQLLSADPPLNGASDLFYGGDASKWIKLINTIRLRSYVLTNNKSAFDAIISGGNYISSAGDDFQAQFGTSELQPDTRHPDYALDYKSDGAEIYQSNWMMNLMLENNDPRIRYYFYRQVSGTPGGLAANGAPVDPSEEDLACSLVVPPAHYAGLPFCSVNGGYWGRSHGNDEGTPPDNLKRTASGVYPAGGRFDDDSFGQVGFGFGGAGAGVEPIILSSYVDFWQGIMAASTADKAAFLQSGLEKSIAKVQSFGSLDGTANLDMAPSAEDVTAYIDGIVEAFNAASGDDQENIFAEQYFTTLFGGSTEAYNYYRLTGYPTTVLPNWEPDPGSFPRSLLIPQAEVINNPNVTQKSSLTTQVFWDTNPASPGWPPAN